QAADALHREVVTGAVARGAGQPEAGDRRVDDAGVERAARVFAQPELFHRAGTEVLDHNVGALHDPACRFAVVRAYEVELDRSLVAIGRQVVRALAADKGRAPAARL